VKFRVLSEDYTTSSYGLVDQLGNVFAGLGSYFPEMGMESVQVWSCELLLQKLDDGSRLTGEFYTWLAGESGFILR